MASYTIQASNHDGANVQPPSRDAMASWLTIFDGPIYSDGAARGYAEELGRRYRSVRVFRHGPPALGHIFYLVINGHAVAV